ncbi:MAG: hypothetical protein IK020_02555 [Clostridiales bacterium]|nr:hypothetical protein [Clostridiales bacterium]MBR5974043.1 hypothetical protein [Clostridiales bacterium]
MILTTEYGFDTINRHTLSLPIYGFVRAVGPYPSGDHGVHYLISGRLQC